MKRFLLIVVCVVAALGAVPASAYDCLDSVDNGYLCAGESGSFEACAWNWTGSTVSQWFEVCADSNSDAWSDFYAEGYGEGPHSYGLYLHNDYLQTHARVMTICYHAQYDVSTSYLNQGTC